MKEILRMTNLPNISIKQLLEIIREQNRQEDLEDTILDSDWKPGTYERDWEQYIKQYGLKNFERIFHK